MIATCPKCTNRYHLDLSSKTVEVILFCPSCNHRWISKRILEPSPASDSIEAALEVSTFKTIVLEKLQKNKNFFIILSCLCILTAYVLQPLIKSGIESVSSLLKNQKSESIPLKIQNVDYFFDEKDHTLSLSWELKNETNSSQGLKPFRIQLFNKCIKTHDKTQVDCVIKEIKFKPSKDIILPKEILRFEHSVTSALPVTKIHIFP